MQQISGWILLALVATSGAQAQEATDRIEVLGTSQDDRVGEPIDLEIRPDGRGLVVLGFSDDSQVTYARVPGSGGLAPRRSGFASFGYDGGTAAAISPNGERAFLCFTDPDTVVELRTPDWSSQTYSPGLPGIRPPGC